MGEDRLSSKTGLLANLGPGFMIITAFVILLILVIAVISLISKKQCTKGSKCRQKIDGTKKKIFFQMIIRYLIMNALKLSMSLIKGVGESTDRGYAIIALTSFQTVPFFFIYLLEVNKNDLDEPISNQQFGNLFKGFRHMNNKGSEVRKLMYFHLIFFVRRQIFMVFTVYCFTQPSIQAVCQMVISLCVTVFMLWFHIFEEKR